MQNKNTKDQLKRQKYTTYQLQRRIYKALSQDLSLSELDRYQWSLKLMQLPKNASKTRLHNRCIFTQRPKGILSKLKMSRIRFRELTSRGLLAGYVKAIW